MSRVAALANEILRWDAEIAEIRQELEFFSRQRQAVIAEFVRAGGKFDDAGKPIVPK